MDEKSRRQGLALTASADIEAGALSNIEIQTLVACNNGGYLNENTHVTFLVHIGLLVESRQEAGYYMHTIDGVRVFKQFLMSMTGRII